jgi:hypothetical protein
MIAESVSIKDAGGKSGGRVSTSTWDSIPLTSTPAPAQKSRVLAEAQSAAQRRKQSNLSPRNPGRINGAAKRLVIGQAKLYNFLTSKSDHFNEIRDHPLTERVLNRSAFIFWLPAERSVVLPNTKYN